MVEIALLLFKFVLRKPAGLLCEHVVPLLNFEEKSHLVIGAVSSLANYGLEACFVGHCR